MSLRHSCVVLAAAQGHFPVGSWTSCPVWFWFSLVFNLGSIRPENLVSQSDCPLAAHLQTFSEERLLSGHSAVKLRLVELSQSRHWVLGYLSHQGPSPLIAPFGWMTRSRRSPGCSKLLPLRNDEGHCAHGDLWCGRILFLVGFPRSLPT